MSIITAMRMVAGLSGGTMTTAQLTAALATPAGAAGWKAAVHSPSMARQLVQEPTARNAWVASAGAVNIAFLSRDFMHAWFSHRDALDKLMVTPAYVTTMLQSSEARIALWSHDGALRALGTNMSTTARASTELRWGSTNTTTNSYTTLFPTDFGRVIALAWGSNAGGSITLTGIRAGSKQPTTFAVSSGSYNDAATTTVIPLEGPVTVKGDSTACYVRYFRAD